MSVRLTIALAVLILLGGQGGLLYAFRRVQRGQQDRIRAIRHEQRQLRALVNIRPLLGEPPLSFGGWAIEPDFAELLVETIVARRPALVVECGSGVSTIVIARCLAALGDGRLVSLEHDGEFAERTRDLACAHAVLDRIDVRLTPLQDKGSGSVWYGLQDADTALFIEGIDVLVVDGPPKAVASEVRYRAVPALAPFFKEGAVVLVDDGDRPGERAVIDRWVQETRATATHIRTERGAWVVTGFERGVNA